MAMERHLVFTHNSGLDPVGSGRSDPRPGVVPPPAGGERRAVELPGERRSAHPGGARRPRMVAGGGDWTSRANSDPPRRRQSGVGGARVIGIPEEANYSPSSAVDHVKQFVVGTSLVCSMRTPSPAIMVRAVANITSSEVVTTAPASYPCWSSTKTNLLRRLTEMVWWGDSSRKRMALAMSHSEGCCLGRVLQLALILGLLVLAAQNAAATKSRLIVITDIGGDPDDQQSMIRLMLYSNEYDIEGLIAGDQDPIRTDLIDQIITAYGTVRSNLLLHASDYPTTTVLHSVVKSGNAGWLAGDTTRIGAGEDTEGSNWIISAVDRADPRPVDIVCWGGQSELAQALWRVRDTRSTVDLAAFVAKIRVHDIANQDGIYTWIKTNFPDLFYILDLSQDGTGCNSVFRGLFYHGDTSYVTKAWIDSNVRIGHGALGALYPKDGLWTCGNGIDGVKEGDTPAYFYFLPKGHMDPRQPTWGGWGGRFIRDVDDYFRDGQDTVGGETSRMATVWRFRPQFQNEFEARMDWCVSDYAHANHSPRAWLNGNSTQDIIYLNGIVGTTVSLNASGSTDPDGDGLSYRWWQYNEADSFAGSVSIDNPTSVSCSFDMPSDSEGDTVHIVLEVEDDGSPSLTAYRRVVVTGISEPVNVAPTASISVPAQAAVFASGDTVDFVGTGWDPEDGILYGDALVWEIDRIGDGIGPVHTAIGVSGSYTFPLDLPTNTPYEFGLAVTDSGGAVGTEMHSIMVQRSPDDGSPSGDGDGMPGLDGQPDDQSDGSVSGDGSTSYQDTEGQGDALRRDGEPSGIGLRPVVGCACHAQVEANALWVSLFAALRGRKKCRCVP